MVSINIVMLSIQPAEYGKRVFAVTPEHVPNMHHPVAFRHLLIVAGDDFLGHRFHVREGTKLERLYDIQVPVVLIGC
jgi:hypothetical protein